MEMFTDGLFGPGVTVQPYDEIEPIFEMISENRYGLQCGVYTSPLDLAVKAIRTIRTEGVIVNGTSRWPHDYMPYGGVKDSGIGRKGPKASMLDMAEERFSAINRRRFSPDPGAAGRRFAPRRFRLCGKHEATMAEWAGIWIRTKKP